MGWLARTVLMSTRRASMSWVMRTRFSCVSSQKASKRSMRASTGSSRSGVGLDVAAPEVGEGGGDG